jgi:predicted nucleic acid-binding protein
VNLVDSSGWLEYFADGPNADFFAPPIEDTERLLVPTICVLEVFKRVMQQRGEQAALQATAVMQQGHLAGLDVATAIFAATLGLQTRLPLADSVVLATARAHNAVVWTQDGDFEGLEDVRFRKKR